MKDLALRESIVAHARSLHARGLSPGTSGNISARAGEGWLLTPTGASLGTLDATRLSLLDGAGRHLDGDSPTKEAPLHLAMYEQRPDAQAIVHLHSSHAVAIACTDGLDPRNALPPLTPYYVMRVGRLPLVPYGRPGSGPLVDAVRAAAEKSHALLLANHGPIVAGRSLEAAVSAIEEIEETARLVLLLHGLPARTLTADQVAELVRPA